MSRLLTDVRQISARSGNLGLTKSGSGGAVAGTGVAAGDRTGRTGSEASVATAGSAERQGIASLEASLYAFAPLDMEKAFVFLDFWRSLGM